MVLQNYSKSLSSFSYSSSAGLSGSSSRIYQAGHVSSFVTLRKGGDLRGSLQVGQLSVALSCSKAGDHICVSVQPLSILISTLLPKVTVRLFLLHLFLSLCLSPSLCLSFFFLSHLQERPKSALERLYGSDTQQPEQPQSRGRMTAEEQLERMKRHQRALVRERKRNLSQGERHSNVSTSTSTIRPLTSDLPTSVRYPIPYPGRHRTHHQRDMAS